MRSSGTGKTLSGGELRELQAVLRKRASNIRKQGKRQGLLRPLSKDVIDSDPAIFRKQITLRRGSVVLSQAPWYLLNPEGLGFSLWNGTAVLLIFALVFYLPVISAYFDEPASCNYFSIKQGPSINFAGVPGQPLTKGWQVFPVLTNYFFLADICIHCLTAVQVNATTKDYSLSVIWYHYLTTWFWLDALACLPLQCILFTAAPHVNWYNTPQFIRLLRVASVWRRSQGNPFRVLDKISDLRQEFSFSARRIAMAAFAELIAIHWFACILWWTIRLQWYPKATWPSILGIVNAGAPEQYCWSIFVLVSAAVQNTWGGFNPITWGEALVWTFAMVIVAVLFAVMVGFIVAAIRSSSRANSRYKDQMDAIVDTLNSNDVSDAVRNRIMAFYRYKYRKGKIPLQQQIYGELPYDMQVEAALETARGFLSKISIIAEEPTLLERVALLLKPTHALVGEQILKQGWPGRSMYFVHAGFVDLIIDGSVADTIYPGDMFGEVALLSLPSVIDLVQACGDAAADVSNYKELFPSIFTAQALTNCDMYLLHAAEFQQLVEEYPGVKAKLQAWALRYAQQMMQYNMLLGPQPQAPSTIPPDTPLESRAASSVGMTPNAENADV